MSNLFESGNFFVGVNYWASNAGIQMWNRWDESVVIRDLDLLAEANIKVIRMFPLWSDFQPIENYRVGNGNIRVVSRDAVAAVDSPEALAEIDPVMAERLDRFLVLCEERQIRVILGLLTGWMSGRTYIPRALEGINLYTDPRALRWELRYIRYLVNRCKAFPAVVAWDLGNECNCFDKCPDADAAYVWSSMISDAIKSIDSTRPVISGMHSLRPEGVWTPMDQGETTDVLCTHPYPAFTPLCDTDPANRMKSGNHAVAESLFYRGCGGKPCFAEEVNILGPMFGNEDVACANTDMALFGLWAHDCLGFMWWCACNQSALTDTPYDWTGLERELGLIYADGTHVPMLDRMTAFSKFTENFGKLPKRIVDAVCILPYKQESWAQAYGTFLLAKQVGLDIEYMYGDRPLPEANAYLIPGLTLGIEPTKRLWNDVLRRVRENGAVLYISMDGGMMSEFCETTGFEVVTRSRSIRPGKTELNGTEIELYPQFNLKLQAKDATVLAADQDGVPVFGEHAYGKGKVYFLSAPIESYMAKTPEATDGLNARNYHEFYRAMQLRNPMKVASQACSTVGLTEHIIDTNSRYLLLLNYEPEAQETEVRIGEYAVADVQSVDGRVKVLDAVPGTFKINLPANTGAVVKIVK